MIIFVLFNGVTFEDMGKSKCKLSWTALTFHVSTTFKSQSSIMGEAEDIFSFAFSFSTVTFFITVLYFVFRFFDLDAPFRRHERSPLYNLVVNRLTDGKQREARCACVTGEGIHSERREQGAEKNNGAYQPFSYL